MSFSFFSLRPDRSLLWKYFIGSIFKTWQSITNCGRSKNYRDI